MKSPLGLVVQYTERLSLKNCAVKMHSFCPSVVGMDVNLK